MRTPSAILLFGMSIAAVAQAQRTPPKTAWDGVYTDAQAALGMTAYSQSCAGCHSLAPEGKAPLVGDQFWKSFSQKTVGDMLEFVRTYMPNGAPGTLSLEAYQNIVALLLKSNGFPAGAAELTANTIAAVRIVPKDGSATLPPDALARVVGCLARSGTDWVVTHATAPQRSEQASSDSQDAAKPLGTRTLALKFVVTKLDSMAGSRVAASGLLIGPDGVDGLNVTEVHRVAPKCP